MGERNKKELSLPSLVAPFPSLLLCFCLGGQRGPPGPWLVDSKAPLQKDSTRGVIFVCDCVRFVPPVSRALSSLPPSPFLA